MKNMCAPLQDFTLVSDSIENLEKPNGRLRTTLWPARPMILQPEPESTDSDINDTDSNTAVHSERQRKVRLLLKIMFG